jgi:hypothetical protein
MEYDFYCILIYWLNLHFNTLLQQFTMITGKYRFNWETIEVIIVEAMYL